MPSTPSQPNESPEVGEVVDCYDNSSIGKIGTNGICKDMLIVNKSDLVGAIANDTYAIQHNDSGKTFTLADGPNRIFTGQITDMSSLFADSNFNGNIGSWDVSRVTSMSDMFYQAYEFNGDISLWDVSNVTNMSETFKCTNLFNQDLTCWNTQNVNSWSNFNMSAKLLTTDKLSSFGTSRPAHCS